MDCIVLNVVRRVHEPWGVEFCGEAPCFVKKVEKGGPADDAGLRKGDCIVDINGVNMEDASLENILQLISVCGRIIRIKLIPCNDETPSISQPEEDEEKFWTEENPSSLLDNTKQCEHEPNENNTDALPEHDEHDDNDDNENEEFDDTDFDKYCEWLENEKYRIFPSEEKQQSKPKSEKSKKKSKPLKKVKQKPIETNETIEQSQFVITRKEQKEFDKTFKPDCTFQGDKAAVAGAFTGDHNKILGKDDDVRGIRSRVMAGIQHFSFEDEQEKIKPEEKGKIIIYSTSLGIHRKVAQDCEQVRNIFKGFRVKFEERDIFNSHEHKLELYDRLGLVDGSEFPEMPRVYLDGVYVGGAEEIQAMSDCGDLRIRLKEFTKFNIRSKCPTCGSSGQIICHSCQGKTFRKKNRFAVLKCGTCQQRGALPCPDCL